MLELASGPMATFVEPQPAFERGVLGAEFEQDLGQSLGSSASRLARSTAVFGAIRRGSLFLLGSCSR